MAEPSVEALTPAGKGIQGGSHPPGSATATSHIAEDRLVARAADFVHAASLYGARPGLHYNDWQRSDVTLHEVIVRQVTGRAASLDCGLLATFCRQHRLVTIM